MPAPEPAAHGLFLIDDSRLPHVKVSWPTRSGGTITLEGDRAYLSNNDKTPLGENVQCFAAVGGMRIETGFGHPRGVVVRVGFYKVDEGELWFRDLAEGASITIEMRGICFNEPGVARPLTPLMHAKYTTEDAIFACGLNGENLNMWTTVSRTQTFNGKIRPDNGRLGALDAASGGRGSVTVTREPDGSLTMIARIPYEYLRHVKDPWLRTTPGGFFEPTHFHVEFEAVPVSVAESTDALTTDGPPAEQSLTVGGEHAEGAPPAPDAEPQPGSE